MEHEHKMVANPGKSKKNKETKEVKRTIIKIALQGTNISPLGNRKIIFKMPF